MKEKTALNAPYMVNLIKGETYSWCACGLSQSQPFCDGSHARTEIEPLVFKAIANSTTYLCGCKHTSNAPMCDSTHLKIILPN